MTADNQRKPGQNTSNSEPDEEREGTTTGDSEEREGRSGVQGAGTG